MKKKIMSVILAGAMCASMVIPAMAETSGEAIPTLDGTDVLAGITLDDPDSKIKVEVPTLFAFVVNGSVKAADTGAVKSQLSITEDGTSETANILLPNVTVEVLDPGAKTYRVNTISTGNWKFTNYSTRAKKDGDNPDLIEADRIGIDIAIVGSIDNEGTAASRNYWEHVAAVNDTTPDTAEFKKYNLEVAGPVDDGSGAGTTAVEYVSFNTADGTALKMEKEIILEAPNVAALGVDPTTKLAAAGKSTDAAFNVRVGGQRNQYKQVEESAKVGTIVWTLGAETQTSAIDTSPNEPALPENVQPADGV